jgi:hypothetical protein
VLNRPWDIKTYGLPIIPPVHGAPMESKYSRATPSLRSPHVSSPRRNCARTGHASETWRYMFTTRVHGRKTVQKFSYTLWRSSSAGGHAGLAAGDEDAAAEPRLFFGLLAPRRQAAVPSTGQHPRRRVSFCLLNLTMVPPRTLLVPTKSNVAESLHRLL